MAVSAIGIDFGTTYCCAAVLLHSNRQPKIIQNDVGGNTTPSFVAYEEEGNVCFGDTAKDLAVDNPESTVFDIKRLIGRSFYDPHIQAYMKLWPFQLVNMNGFVGVRVGEQSILPQTVAQELLSHLRKISQVFLHCTIESAVVTIPAYFNDMQKGLTREACYKAGLNKVEFITEPQAAAYAYGLEASLSQGKSKFCLIFDLGGGTFDVTIFKISSGNEIEIKATDGDDRLGGEDFNDLLMEYCIKDFQSKHGIDLTAGKNSEDSETRLKAARVLRKLRNECEKKKIQLSFTKKVVVFVEALCNGIDFNLAITRNIFEDLIESHLNKCLATIDTVLQRSGLQKDEIDDVVLIGGSSRIPKVEQVVSEYFGGIQVHRDINADEAVAYGAALHAYNVFHANEDCFATARSSQFTSAEVGITSTSNVDVEEHFTNLRGIRDLLKKHKAHFLSKANELSTWLTNFKKLEKGFRENKRASEYELNALLDSSTLQELAFILFEHREDKDAGELYQKIHDRLKATVGENDINAIKMEVFIARCSYRHDFFFGEKLTDYVTDLKNAHKRMSNVLGEKHADTLEIQYFIALSLWYNSEYSDALEFAEKVYNSQTLALGSESIGALRTQALKCWCFHHLKRKDDAATLAILLFKKQHKFLDSTDSETLSIKLGLSCVLWEVGKFDESLRLAEGVYEAQRKSLTDDQTAVLYTRRIIAMSCTRLKEYDKGIYLFESIHKSRVNLLGENHRFTLTSQFDIAWATDWAGRKSKAVKLYKELYDKQVQMLGPNDKDTLKTKAKIDGPGKC